MRALGQIFNRGTTARRMIAAATPTLAHSARHWIYGLGGLGFIPLGFLDSSIIPLPGSMDVLTIILAARNGGLWIYYAAMATIGSVAGAYLTYRLARKGGTAALERKLPKKRLEKSYKIFNRWGFGAIAVPALLPPPMPLVPFVLAAGAMKYSVTKFLAAMTLGRAVRYSILAYLSAVYGRTMLNFLSRLGHSTILIVVVVAMSVAACVYLVLKFNKHKRKRARA
jgi:membrane protein YqaA with SNARE-associated domain